MKSRSYNPFKLSKKIDPIALPKSKWKKVKPPRCLYHLSYKNRYNDSLDLKRYSIAKEGLWGIESGKTGVWANVQYLDVVKMWLIVIDGFECDGDWGHFIESNYDVWRIDTKMLKNKWYLDPVMDKDECNAYSIHQNDYLFTENTIQPNALRLYSFICNVKYISKQTFFLSPVEEINKYILYNCTYRKKEIEIEKT
jgi:hypothetical protein